MSVTWHELCLLQGLEEVSIHSITERNQILWFPLGALRKELDSPSAGSVGLRQDKSPAAAAAG